MALTLPLLLSLPASFLWWQRSNDLVQGQQEGRKPSQRIAESTPGIISFTTPSPSTFWEIFLFISLPLLSPRNFTSLSSGFPKTGSGKAGKESKPLHFVLLEPALPSPLKLCRSFYLCLFYLYLPALEPGLVKWQKSEPLVNIPS